MAKLLQLLLIVEEWLPASRRPAQRLLAQWRSPDESIFGHSVATRTFTSKLLPRNCLQIVWTACVFWLLSARNNNQLLRPVLNGWFSFYTPPISNTPPLWPERSRYPCLFVRVDVYWSCLTDCFDAISLLKKMRNAFYYNSFFFFLRKEKR